ncbi:MAG: hypothetical protein RLZZ399_159 [Verrucomicrobiota bacterium]|jgi:TolA-binding protein
MSQAPESPTPKITAEEQPFDLFDFWLRHKASIQTVAGIVVVGLTAYGVLEWQTARKTAAAAEAFATAKTPEQLASFVSTYPSMPLAGNAALLLAEKQRSEKKYDEAQKTLREFISRSPNHPLISAARLSVATTLEQQGKTEDALASYRSLAASDPRGFATPVAWLRVARILRSEGKIAEAKAAYETLQSQFPKSVFASDALLEAQELTPKTTDSAPAPEAKPATP